MNLIDDEKRKADLLTSFGNKDVAAMCTKSRQVGTLGISFVNCTNMNLTDHLKTSSIYPISEYFDH